MDTLFTCDGEKKKEKRMTFENDIASFNARAALTEGLLLFLYNRKFWVSQPIKKREKTKQNSKSMFCKKKN